MTPPKPIEFTCDFCGVTIDEGQEGAFFVEVVRWGRQNDGWAENCFCSQEHVASWFSQPQLALNPPFDEVDEDDDDTTRLEDVRDFAVMVILPTLVAGFAGLGVFSLVLKLTTGEW